MQLNAILTKLKETKKTLSDEKTTLYWLFLNIQILLNQRDFETLGIY